MTKKSSLSYSVQLEQTSKAPPKFREWMQRILHKECFQKRPSSFFLAALLQLKAKNINKPQSLHAFRNENIANEGILEYTLKPPLSYHLYTPHLIVEHSKKSLDPQPKTWWHSLITPLLSTHKTRVLLLALPPRRDTCVQQKGTNKKKAS